MTNVTTGTVTTTQYLQDYPYSGQVHRSQTKLADGTVTSDVEKHLPPKLYSAVR
ncbi:MAG: hypothetical protein IBX57_11855 [Gammaproteobacteria bacterium]|nr:hypothetical protein [Gammaproteobacteria bacterium]